MGSSQIRVPKPRRRDLVQSASKKLTSFSNSISKRAAFSELENESKFEISQPFNFRNMSDVTSPSVPAPKVLTMIPRLQKAQPNNQFQCASPLEKPLPSLPCLTFDSQSPTKPKRSLIDAEEKPLRRSISPAALVYEDWPSLSPQKQRALPLTEKADTPVAPSWSESLYECIENSKLRDGMDSGSYSPLEGIESNEAKINMNVSPVHAGKGTSKVNETSSTTKSKATHENAVTSLPVRIKTSNPFIPSSSPTMVSPASIRKDSSNKTRTPKIRQTRTSEMRLRKLTENTEERKIVSPQSSNRTVVKSSNETLRARPAISASRTTQGHHNTVSRSHSQHRVTSHGSPYVSFMEERKDWAEPRDGNSSFFISSTDVSMNFDLSDGITHAPEVFAIKSTRSNSRHSRKSSIPLPNRRLQESTGEDSEAEVTIQPASRKSSTVAREDNSSDGDIDTDRDHENSTDMSYLSHTYNDLNSSPDYVNTAIKVSGSKESPAAVEPEVYLNSEKRSAVPVTMSSENVSLDFEDGETFRVKSLSKITPGRGPLLRISPLADSIILGKELWTDSEVSKRNGIVVLSSNSELDNAAQILEPLGMQTSGVVQQQSELGKSSEEELTLTKHPDLALSKHNSYLSSNIALSGEPIDDQGHDDRKDSVHCKTSLSAPPIKSGTPADKSSPVGWPFQESVVAPFKTFTTSEHNKVFSSNSTENTRVELNTTACLETSPGMSIRSRYNVNEALQKIQPIEEKAATRSTPAGSDAAAHKARLTSASPNFVPIPQRSPLRQTGSRRTTGYRTPSSRQTSRVTTNKPEMHAPPSIPQHVKSLPRSTSHGDFGSLSSNKRNQTLSSPATLGNATPASKSVIQNIRELFHKRSNLHSGLTASVHHATSNTRGSILRKSLHANSASPSVSPFHRLPRSPRGTRTSPLRLRPPQAPLSSHSTSPRVFPEHKGVRPLASTQSLHPVPSPGPALQADSTSPSRSVRNFDTLSSATALAHHLLTFAAASASPDRKTELIESSKILVATLNMARDSEKSLEEAKQAVAKCEVAALGIRAQVARIETFVREKVGMNSDQAFEMQ